ncbi:MAG: fold metallo-hydrolase [Myxococcales bacterium]|nr:fold metallo-hydrolase [Myxococcales bacterium]
MTTPAFLPPDIAPASARAPDIVLTLPGDAPSERELRVVRLGHASVMVQWGADTLLTDPWFSQQGAFPGYYSGESLAMGVADLPDLTGVLGSMDHWDHFDVQHFAAYRDRAVPVIVPAGTKQRAQAVAAGFTDVRALGPWGSVGLGAFSVTAICTKPAQAPTSFEYEHAYLIEVGGRRVLFCAHLMTPEVQAEVAARFGRIDIAIVAVNGLALRGAGRHQLSMGPDDAAALCARLGVEVVVPIHYTFRGNWISNAFRISHPGTPEALADAARVRAPSTDVMTLWPGQRLSIHWGDDARPEADPAVQKRAALLRFFARLDAGDLDAFELFAPDFVHHHPLPGSGDGTRDGARRGMARLREAIPDVRITVERLIVEGEAAAVRILTSGTLTRPLPGLDAPLGPIRLKVSMLYRFAGAQIAEEWIDRETSTTWASP